MNVLYEKLFGKMNSIQYPDKLSLLPDFENGFTLYSEGKEVGSIADSMFHSEIITGENEVIGNITDGIFDSTNINWNDGSTFFGIPTGDGNHSWINPFDGSHYNLSQGVDGEWHFGDFFSSDDIAISDNMLGGFDLSIDSDLDSILTGSDSISDLNDLFDSLDGLDAVNDALDYTDVFDSVLSIFDWSDL